MKKPAFFMDMLFLLQFPVPLDKFTAQELENNSSHFEDFQTMRKL